MSDVYQSVQHHSLGDNLAESIKGFLVGVLLFIAAFPVLWMNEGCTDMSEVAKTAVVVKADSPGTTGEGKLVSATADLKVDDTVGDAEMTLVPGPYVKLHRKVEMFAWNEKKESKTEKKLGGGSVTTTTYTYDEIWTDSPKSSDSFSVPTGHTNPSLTVHPEDFYPAHAKVGAFSFSPKECELPSATPLSLTPAMVKLPPPGAAPTPAATPAPAVTPKTPPGRNAPKGKGAPAPAAPAAPAPDPTPPGAGAFKLVSGYLFRGHGTPEAGKLGDVRVSFETVLPGNKVTLYGKRQGTAVAAYITPEKSEKFFRVVPGTHEQAIAQLHGEHVAQTWIVRILGFIFMWAGLGLILGPLNSVLDIVPFVGSAGRFVTSVAMFPVALILSTVTIVIAIIAHSTILLVITFVVIAGGLTALILFKRKKVPAGAAPAGGMPPAGYGGPPQGYGGPPQGGYGPPPGGGGYGPPPGGGGYGPPPGGGGYGPPPGGGGYGPPPGGGGYGPPPGGGGPPPGGGYGPPPGGH